MRVISTGEPSNLTTFRKIALFLNDGDLNSKAVKYFDRKIAESPLGGEEEVREDEREMILFIRNLTLKS